MVRRAVRIEIFSALVFDIIEYSIIWLIPQVASNYRVVQNKQMHNSLFKFVVQNSLK